MKFQVVTGSPVPAAIGALCEELASRTGANLNSGFRGDPAESLLRRLGKSTQRMLFEGFIRGLPGFNPANPPKQSTHECFSDGVPYPGPIGRALAGWQCGTDWSNSEAVLQQAKQMGVAMARPYSDGREFHHLNVMEPPRKWGWKPKPPSLTVGSRGKRVGQLTGRLAYLGYNVAKTGKYDTRVARAVKQFQGRHSHLADDGIAGHMTEAQLKVGVREKKRRRSEVKRSKSSTVEKRRALAKIDRTFTPPDNRRKP